jgi:hypothetical protein
MSSSYVEDYIEDVKDYVTSNSGKPNKMVDQRGFVYCQIRTTESTGKGFFKCSLWHMNKCMVRASVVQNKIKGIRGETQSFPSKSRDNKFLSIVQCKLSLKMQGIIQIENIDQVHICRC